MSDLPKSVKLKEVGPREGFQFEKGAIGLQDKISLVDALSDTGVKTIEFTSFVSPKWVPQMADAEQMVAGIKRAPGVAYEAIWLNEAGLERAARLREALALRPMFSVAGSDTFMRKNTNRSVDERLAELPGWAERYQKDFNFPPDVYGVAYYDGMFILKQAIEKAGLEPQALRDAIAATKDYKGIGATFSFDQRGEGVHQVVVVKPKPGTKTYELLETVR